MDIKYDISSKKAREYKIAHKTELHVALREAAAKQRYADRAEKKAMNMEAKAEKLLSRARQVQIDAEKARLRANMAGEAAMAAQQVADQKLIATRNAVAKLSEVEVMEKSAKKLAIKRKKSNLKVSARSGKTKSRQANKLVGAT